MSRPNGKFDGRDAVIIKGPGTVNVFYGGVGEPDGPGHGHVKATGGPEGENIVFWRLPASEGGTVMVSNAWGTTGGNDHTKYRLAWKRR